jgi:hypothetical protein
VPNTIEIKTTMRGFAVTTGERTASFPTIEDVLDFARQRLRLEQELRELARRCE